MRILFGSLLVIGIITLAGMAQTPAPTVRIGTFDKRTIVVAFYRSPIWAEVLKEKLAARDAARKAGDTNKVRELESWGRNHQDVAHRQLEGEADISNIMEALAPAFQDICQKERLARVVPATEPGASATDVTRQLLDWLKADATTRKIVEDLRRQKQ
jgi:hypothetical protein